MSSPRIRSTPSSAYLLLWTIMSACCSRTLLLVPLRQSLAWQAAQRQSSSYATRTLARQRLQKSHSCSHDRLGGDVAADSPVMARLRHRRPASARCWMSTSSSSEGPATTEAAAVAEDEEKAAVQAAREARKYDILKAPDLRRHLQL
jgi:hypothetical protein